MNGEKEGASMELGHGIFDVKLHELKREYVRMQSRLRLFQGKDFGSSGRDRAEAGKTPAGEALCGVCYGFCDPDYEVCDDHRPERHETSDPGG